MSGIRIGCYEGNTHTHTHTLLSGVRSVMSKNSSLSYTSLHSQALHFRGFDSPSTSVRENALKPLGAS